MERHYIVRSPGNDWIEGFGIEFPSASHEQGIPVGARFYRIDLQTEYRWTGTAWNAAGGGSAPTVQEVDGTPAVASVGTLKFDQDDGFVVTDEGGGVARVDGANSTTLRHGLLPTLSGNAAQYLDGSGAWSTPAAAPAPDQDARIYGLMAQMGF